MLHNGKFSCSIKFQAFSIIILLVLCEFISTAQTNQSISDSIKNKIDSLFKQWDSPNAPGGAVGIIRKDSLIYARGHGMADLEQQIPITPQSIFYMCS